jgi:hypothetical protein
MAREVTRQYLPLLPEGRGAAARPTVSSSGCSGWEA